MADMEKRIRSFLVATPRPTKIVVHCEEGVEHELGAAKSGTTWAGIARSIMALHPETIHAYIGDRIERAMSCDEDEEKERVNVSVPSALSTDPETARLTHFANLLHRAYEHTTNVAFERMCDMQQMLNDRAIALEARVERNEARHLATLREQLDDERERFEEERDEVAKQLASEAQNPVNQLLGAFAGGVQQSQAEKPNGSPKP